MHYTEKHTSNKEIALLSPTEPNTLNLSSLQVRDIRVFLENSCGERFTKECAGDSNLAHLLHKKANKITVGSIDENRLTLKIFLDEDIEESNELTCCKSTLLGPIIDEDEERSFDILSHPVVKETCTESREKDKISLYYDSRLEQRKGEAKSKRCHFLPSSILPISNLPKNKLTKISETAQPNEGPTLNFAQIEKNSFSKDISKIKFDLPSISNRQPTVEIMTFSRLLKRNICYNFNLPVCFHHFHRPENVTFRPSGRQATVNPVFINEINDSINGNQESIEMKDNKKSCVVPSLIFYQKCDTIPQNNPGTWVSLCSSCFNSIHRTLEVRNDRKNENYCDSSSKLSSVNEMNLHEEKIPFDNNESDHEDEETMLEMLKSLKDECLDKHSAIVNNHLLNIDISDPNELNISMRFLRRNWLEEVSNKSVSIEIIRFYKTYFQAFSDNLFKMIVYTTDITGNNVLHFAFNNNRFDVAELFLSTDYAKDLLTMKNKAGHSAFMVCSISNPQTKLEWFTIYKAVKLVDLNQVSDNNAQTPLMNAARNGSDLMIKLLLEAGANPNIQDVDGSTALMYAAEYGHEKCAKYLLNNPLSDPNIKDKDGETACSIALTAGHKNIALFIYLKIIKKETLESIHWITERYNPD